MTETRHLNPQGAHNVPSLLKELLRDLSLNSPILGAAVFTVEGHPVVSYFHAGTEDAAVAAMVAGIHSAAEQVMRELRQGSLKSIIVEGEGGNTLVLAVTGGYLLTVTSPENAKIGLVFNDAKRVAREAGRLLQELI